MMRYSAKIQKICYGFLSFAKNFGNKYGKLMDTATKTGMDAAKTTS